MSQSPDLGVNIKQLSQIDSHELPASLRVTLPKPIRSHPLKPVTVSHTNTLVKDNHYKQWPLFILFDDTVILTKMLAIFYFT